MHLDPVAVRAGALDRRVAGFIVLFRDGDAVSFHASRQHAHVSRPRGLEADMQERGRRLDVLSRVQCEAGPGCVADDDDPARLTPMPR